MLGTIVQYVMLLRFTLLFPALLLLLPLFGWKGTGTIGNMLVLSRPGRGTMWVPFMALAGSWTSMMIIFIILKHSNERLRGVPPELPTGSVCAWVLVFALIAMPFVLLVGWRSWKYQGILATALWMLSGAALACVWLAAALSVGGELTLTGRLGQIEVLASMLDLFASLGRFVAAFGGSLILRFVASSPGYIDPGIRQIYPEHIQAAVAATLILVGYAYGAWDGYRLLRSERPEKLRPTLVYLMLLVLLLAMILSAAMFFLDRYRVPVVLVVLVCSAVAWQIGGTDHLWPFVEATSPPDENARPVAVNELLDGWLKKRGETQAAMVVVCASGGGIEAAVWTANVLVGLQRELGDNFADSIKLISSTSGGSVGALHYVSQYYENLGPPNSRQLDSIVKAAEKSSLPAEGWGVAHPDFVRLLFPISYVFWGKAGNEVDRGWALEQAWRAALPGGARHQKLSAWKVRVREGKLPGTVFNATVVERGTPFPLNTVELADDRRSEMFGQNWHPGADISTVTAARLSATFAYVSPVARPECSTGKPPDDLDIHIADGGYFDNYGVTQAVNWIRQLLTAGYDKKLGQIVIIQIAAFPDESLAAQKKKKDVKTQRNIAADVEKKRPISVKSGWSDEIAGPIKVILNARDATQLARDDQLISGLQEDYKDLVTAIPITATIKGPLSWALSPDEIKAIHNDWDKQSADVIKELRKFFPASATPSAPPPNPAAAPQGGAASAPRP